MAKISLCMIVGNCEAYIERCLNSFAPIADEICMVRAIGNQEPDGTIDKAKALFPSKLKVVEYKNTPEHADWPHIDNFAAARQQSFDLATGNYIFWCDTDDVLESGADVVRELAERGGYPCFMFPYRIFARGLNLKRARMVARNSGQWHFAVHEDFRFHIEPVQAVEDERVVVTHLPFIGEKNSVGRNLRILESLPESEMTTGLHYHHHVELALAGRLDDSIAEAKKVLAAPDGGIPEKYEIFLNFAQCARDIPEQKEAFLLQAFGVDPRRREALGLLANCAMDQGKPDFGLAYARQMMATPLPDKPDWTHRSAIYGWVGCDTYAQALRANGRYQEADQVRLSVMAQEGLPRIALVHATRGRPEQAAMARKIWLDFAEKPALIEHIFVIDEDDKDSRCLARMHHIIVQAGGGCVAAWNQGALCTMAPVLIQLSDDWYPVPGWDEMIINRLGDLKKASVLAISDGMRNDDLLCMAICTRPYFELDWFLFHPWFKGVYSDNWFSEQAYKRGAVIDAKDIVFEHRHFLKTGDKPDKTYSRQNSPEAYHEGKTVLETLQLGTDWSTVPGFFNYYPFYESVARHLKDGDVVAEVGVWLGRSLIFLAQTCRRMGKNVRFIAVDHFKGESNQKEHEATVKECGGNLRKAFEDHAIRCGVRDMIDVFEGESVEIATHISDGALSFCFIDAAHDYESVKADILAWKPKVKQGGILAGHDAQYPPVMKAVDELFPDRKLIGCVWMKS